MNEDGSETVEDVPGDSGAHNPLLAAVASTVAAATTAASAAATERLWQEGVNYTRHRAGPAHRGARRTSRGAGVFLVRLPAL